MAEADTEVCLNAKVMPPAMSIMTALSAVSKLEVFDSLKLVPTIPKLKISSSAPKTTPLIPASESNRLVVNE